MMSPWIFLNDLGVSNDFDQAINLNAVTHFNLRHAENQLVLFFGGQRDDPHILNFNDSAACQNAYDVLKEMLNIPRCNDRIITIVDDEIVKT